MLCTKDRLLVAHPHEAEQVLNDWVEFIIPSALHWPCETHML